MSLKQIWILQESGTCVFHRKYDKNSNDENLISGFLSAVNSFVGSFGAEIKWIETNKYRFVFNMSDQLIFVACTGINDHAPFTYKRLCRISDHFNMMFGKDLFESGDPIPIDIFKKIAPTVNRIFGIADDYNQAIVTKPAPLAKEELRFDTKEARLMSFIRYKRRVSISDIVHFLRIPDEEAENALNKLENRRFIQRTEHPDGSEKFGIHPIVRSMFS
ncbi:MAG: hypothetical protein HZR80_17720 [Candidatus Heimdallarchaeota archaeon]